MPMREQKARVPFTGNESPDTNSCALASHDCHVDLFYRYHWPLHRHLLRMIKYVVSGTLPLPVLTR